VLKALALVGLLACGADAFACSIQTVDLTGQLKPFANGGSVAVQKSTDEDSKEPVRRYAILLKNGDLVVLEQRHCEMYNLRLTLLSKAREVGSGAVTIMADILRITPAWKKGFGALYPREILSAELSSKRFARALKRSSPFSYSIDDVLSSRNANSEVLLSFGRLAPFEAPFTSVFSLSVGIGGL
jgi:hypothetical protein